MQGRILRLTCTLLLLIVAGALVIAWRSREESSAASDLRAVHAAGGAPARLDGSSRPERAAVALDVSDLLARGMRGDRAAWGTLASGADRLSREQRAEVRLAVRAQMGYITHPTADYRGGAEAIELAAAVADASLLSSLLNLIESWDLVVAKLPLTEQRDDLVALAAIRAAVTRVGSPEQEAQLASGLRRLAERSEMHEQGGDGRDGEGR